MRRCFDLARLGAGMVSPNPRVGALLVYKDRIIGEGYHKKYGEGHAEVEAIRSVSSEDLELIPKATIYISLEPCCIYGKTPPCTSLIIEKGIKRVVISCLDRTPGVAGKGVEILRNEGIEVTVGILEKEGKWLSRFRSTFVEHHRPHTILKFARSRDGFMGYNESQVWISNQYTKRWVHKCRSEIGAILIGTNTAATDNPQLTNRLYFGRSPLRIILDKTLRLPSNLKIFDGHTPTWIINEKKEEIIDEKNLRFIKIDFGHQMLPELLKALYQENINSLIVEGGASTLKSFIRYNLWDEAYILEGNKILHRDIKAPDVPGHIIDEQHIGNDKLTIYQNSFHRG